MINNPSSHDDEDGDSDLANVSETEINGLPLSRDVTDENNSDKYDGDEYGGENIVPPQAADVGETRVDDAADDVARPSGIGDAAGPEPTPANGLPRFPGTVGPSTIYRPLLRDPDGRFGGVASGIGKRYGIDVSLLRLAFIVFALTGVGLLAYLIAWVAIPKSAAPLVPAPISSKNTKRAAGAALVLAAIVSGLAVTGESRVILIVLVLLGGGMWLLLQAEGDDSTTEQPAPSQGRFSAQVGQSSSSQASQSYALSALATDAYVARPDQPRATPSGKKRGLKLLLASVAITGALFLSLFIVTNLTAFDGYFESVSDSIQIESDQDAQAVKETQLIAPSTLKEVPDDVFGSFEPLVIDLSELKSGTAEGLELPVEADFTVVDGTMKLILPQDVAIRVDAAVESGTLDYLGSVSSGAKLSREFGAVDADLRLDLNVIDGDLRIEKP